jgi:hypothetical protein
MAWVQWTQAEIYCTLSILGQLGNYRSTAASMLTQQSAKESHDSSNTSTPPVARPSGRAQSLSAPLAPTRDTSTTVGAEPAPEDEDVPMVSTDAAGNDLSAITEDNHETQE